MSNDDQFKKPGKGPFGNYKLDLRDTFYVTKLYWVRLAELTLQGLEDTISSDGSQSEFDELYMRAVLDELTDRLNEVLCSHRRFPLPVETMEDLDEQVSVLCRRHPEFAKVAQRADRIYSDVATRLESAKRRIADQFNKEFRQTVNKHEITSPVEQIFLIEWGISQIERRYKVRLMPQETIKTSAAG